MAVSTVADFVEALRRWPLLDDVQFSELSDDLQQRFTEPRALAKELLNRGWLTPYQVNHLATGKAAELLLGSYVLLERLGEGGMGAVFKARHRRLDRIVAIKLIRKERLADEEAVKRFHREIRAVAQLSHPHIVLAFDADEADGVHFFAMEYVDGTDLGKQVQQHGPLPIGQACEYLRQAALALQHAHHKGLVHRDIKPSNLLLASGGREPPVGAEQTGGLRPPLAGTVKLLDLGLARLRRPTTSDGPDSSLTEVGIIVGTPDFMAPEQAEDSHHVDIRGDLYSLGCTAYFLLSGQVPFPDLTPMEKLFHHRYHEPRPIEEWRPEVPPAVAVIVRKLMAKRPEDRFQTPAEVVAALETVPPPGADTAITQRPSEPAAASATFRDIVPSDSHTSAPSPRKEKRSAERRRWLWLNVGAAVVLLGALGLFVALLGQRGGTAPEDGKGEDPHHKAAVAEMRALKARAADVSADRDALRLDLLAFRRTYPGTPEALQAAGILRWLPSPLDELGPVENTPTEGWDGRAADLVAVLGDARQRHWGPAGCVALSADGKTLASGGDDHAIRLWDTATLRERAVLRGHTAAIAGIAFSPDGKQLLSTGAAADRTLRLWDVATGKELSPRLGNISSAVYAADGKHVLCGSKGWFGLWSPESGQVVRRFENLPGFVTQLAAAHDGKNVLFTIADEKLAHLWDLEAGKELRRLEGHQGEVHFVAFSADSKHALTGSVSAGRLWDVASGKELFRLPHTGAQNGAFAPDGKHFLTCGADKAMRLWDTANGKAVRPLIGHEAPVRAVVFSGDGKRAYSAGADTTVRRWDVESGKEIEPLTGPIGGLTNVVFGPEGRLLVGGLRARRLFVWDVTGETKYRPFAEEAPGVQQIALAPDGRLALSAGDVRAIPIWDMTTTQRTGALGNQEAVRCVAISPDGQLALAGAGAGSLRLWEVASGKELHRLDGHKGVVAAAAFAADGRQAVSAADQSMRLWDVASGKEVRSFLGLPGPVRGVAFSPDGRRLFSVGGDPAVRRWALDGTSPPSLLDGKHSSEAVFVTVSPDAQSVASGTETGEVIVWELSTGKRQFRWQLPGPISGLAFASDSRHLATANGNGTVYILRLAPPEPKASRD